jgi:hypothetical protein
LISSSRIISGSSGGVVTIDPNPTLLSQLADAVAARDAALLSLSTAQDFAVRIPTSWTKYQKVWNSNPTLAGFFANIEHDASVPGLTVFTESGKTCLRCKVSSTQATISSGKRAEGKWNALAAVCRTGMRSRLKFDIRFDLAGGKWFSNANWAVCGQCHGYLPTGSPPLGFEIHGDRIRLRIMPDYHEQRDGFGNDAASGVLWVGSVAAFNSAWQTFEITTQFGLDANASWVEFKLNGALVLPRTFIKTLLFDTLAQDYNIGTPGINTTDGSWACVGDASPGYWKLGLYQNATIAERIVEYKDMEFEAWTPVY